VIKSGDGTFHPVPGRFAQSSKFQLFTWLKVIGDLTFVLGGVLPIVSVIVRGMFHLRPAGGSGTLAAEHAL
jgi:hypothetical protein